MDVRISVIITCFNQREFIRDAVDSALSQSSPHTEIIVVDDGSTDGSAELLREYGDRIKLFVLSSNRGGNGARNYGAAHAKGDYLAFLDGDDVLMPWALNLYEHLIEERKPKIILGQRRWFKGQVPRIANEQIPRQAEFVSYDALMHKDRTFGWSCSTFVIERELLKAVGAWSDIEYLDIVDLVRRLGYSGHAIMICWPQTVLFRIHAANSIHRVGPFIRATQQMIDREKNGLYPGGQKRRLERYAWLGTLVACHVKRGLQSGLWKDSVGLAVSGCSMIGAAILQRLKVSVVGRHSVETLTLAPCSARSVGVDSADASRAIRRSSDKTPARWVSPSTIVGSMTYLRACMTTVFQSPSFRLAIAIILAVCTLSALLYWGHSWDLLLHGHDIHKH